MLKRLQPNIGDDILDTRDVDDLIEELTDELEEFDEEAFSDFENLDDDELEEKYGSLRGSAETVYDKLVELLSFKEELEGYCDWEHGETLINEDYREKYAEEFAHDIGAVGDNSDWIKIDWKATAEELFRYDYTSAEIQGETYYVRAH